MGRGGLVARPMTGRGWSGRGVDAAEQGGGDALADLLVHPVALGVALSHLWRQACGSREPRRLVRRPRVLRSCLAESVTEEGDLTV